MPNYCQGEMKVLGYKDNVDEFGRILNADYSYRTNMFSYPYHFFRIFEVYPYAGDPIINGVCKEENYSIECAWSLHSCMMPGPFTYYDDVKASYPDNFHGTNLIEQSKRLGLTIEAYSQEPGIGFMEHIIVSNGIVIKNDSTEWSEYYIGDCKDAADVNEQFGLNLTQKEFEECNDMWGGYYHIGGYDWDYYETDDWVNMANRIMVKREQ